MKKTILSFLLILSAICISFTGCKSVPTANKASALMHVANIGTAECLIVHPEWRDGFELAVVDLKTLEASTNGIGISQVMEIVGRLPVKQLKDPQARLLISEGTLILEELGTPKLSLDQVQNLLPYVTALRQGIEFALQ